MANMLTRLSMIMTSSSLVRTASPTSCCQSLATSIGSQVYFPYSGQYSTLNGNRWSDTSILSPACVVTPSTVEDVSQIIRILTLGASRNATGCDFAIKSGGHNPNPGANDINDGVTIDLQNLNGIIVSADRSTVRIGVGNKWQDAYDQVPDLLFPGGLCGDTGVGGVTLGGGMSLLLPKVGWVVDNILEFEVVLANGTVVHASATQQWDLFRALKGGGSNFGILTAVTVKAYAQQTSIWAGSIVNIATPNATAATIKAMTDFAAVNNNITNAAVQTAFFFSAKGPAIESFIADTNDREDSPALAPFLRIPNQLSTSLHHLNMSAVAEEATSVQPHGWRDLTATLTFENSIDAMAAVQSISTSVWLATNDTVPNMEFIIFYIPLPKVVNKFGSGTIGYNNGNVLGLDTSKDRISVSLNPRWKDAAYDSIMYQSARDWVNQSQIALQRMGKLDPFLYLNYAAPWQRPFQGYGQGNFAFLRNTAAKYDPEGVFQRQMPGGFNLQ